MQSVHDAQNWLQSLKPFGYKPGNERMLWMLERLGHPERRLKFIHIAGTNGKGSNVAFLSSVLRTSGYDVGAYISPHITTYWSRISYNGIEIEGDALLAISRTLEPLVEELAVTELGSPTEFEVLTTIAIVYFAQHTYPDIVLWETGLGGRFDSTNVVHPLLTIITNVGLDHTKILGDTLAQIAWDKAGIIKGGVPVITAVEDEEAYQVIADIASEKRAKVYRLGGAFDYSDAVMNTDGQRFTFRGPYRDYRDISLGLRGLHQFKNAATSMMALEILRQSYAFQIEAEDIATGMADTMHPGRLEVVSEAPLIVLDGAHNAHGTGVVSASIPQLYRYRELTLVLSIMEDKPVDAMLDDLLPLAHQVIITRANNPRALTPVALQQKIISKNPQLPIYIVEEPIAALDKALAITTADDLLLIAGSLYLIETIREVIRTQNATGAGVD